MYVNLLAHNFQKKAKTAALTNANRMRDELLAMENDDVDDQVKHLLFSLHAEFFWHSVYTGEAVVN